MEQEQFKKEIISLKRELLSYAKRFLKNGGDSEDLVQEVFLKMWCIRDELYRYNKIAALSVRITRNLCLNRLKRSRTTGDDINKMVVESEELSPYKELEQKSEMGILMKILDRLPDMQQMIIRMKHIEGFEVEEIAEITGSSPDAVRKNLSRGRQRIKEMFLNIQR